MRGWWIVLAVTGLVLCYPFARFCVKRMILGIKLCRACKRCGATVRRTHVGSLLATRGGRRADYIIETPTQIFSVKLFATHRHASQLIFTEDGRYYVRHFLAVFAHYQKLIMPMEGRRRLLPQYDFLIDSCDGEKPCTRVLLVHPICMEIRRTDIQTPLGDGDSVGDMTLLSLSGLLRLLDI